MPKRTFLKPVQAKLRRVMARIEDGEMMRMGIGH